MINQTPLPSSSIFSPDRLVDGLRRQWQELTQTNASPRNLALAFALGTFISLLPTPGLNILLVGGLNMLFRQLHRGALLAAVAVWNAFVVAPFYALSHAVGGRLYDTMLGGALRLPWGGEATSLTLTFLLGNLVVAFTVTAVSFILVQSGLRYSRARRARA